MLERRTYFTENGAGWRLALHRYRDPTRLDRSTRPVVIVPGFAMNAYILGYHPTGRPLAAYLADHGLEVFCVELRGQGHAHPVAGRGRRRGFGLADVGVVDLGAVIDAVPRYSALPEGPVDAVGCSLGATYVFMQAAWRPQAPLRRLVNLGGPLAWTTAHPFVRALAQLPLGFPAMRGTRTLARLALPAVARVPGVLDIYMNPRICDLSRPESLVHTVDDPVARINFEIARWIRRRDLVLDGRNLTADLARVDRPLLTVVANADGIVPEAVVRTGDETIGAPASARRVVIAGDARTPMAHADLFISELAERTVFAPLAEWLTAKD
jgi:predicted alpha/beta hydrolase